MTDLMGSVKRVVVGKPQESERLAESLLPKRLALPVFASDALSSVSYATQEILIVLAVGGVALYAYTPWVGAAVVLLMLIVVASYRQNVHAYPSGGGDYEVVTTNLGAKPGLVVAAALLVDYVLTVAVSISSAIANMGSAFPWISANGVVVAVGLIGVMTLVNLRGVRESGTAFAIPTYLFIVGMFTMFGWAIVRLISGDQLRAESADYELIAEEPDLLGLALVLVLLRAFASGCTALTGVEAISNGVPAFRKPKSTNAAATLVMLGVLSVSMFSGVTALALKTDVKVAEVSEDLVGLPEGESQKTVIAQIADAVFGSFEFGFLFIAVTTALILVLAANTAFNGFPVLGSILARDRYLPRQLYTRGDRLAFSNGILVLAAAAIALVVIFDANVTALIQLYILGVFISFTLSQLGMIRHWTRLLAGQTDPERRGQMLRSRVINGVGFAMTGTVLIIVLVSKFSRGAWIVCVAIPILVLIMSAIKRHYDAVAAELVVDGEATALPPRVHSIVLVSKVNKPVLRAIAYARATRPDTLEALTAAVDDEEAERLLADWDGHRIPVPLKVLHSPYREVTRPVVDYVRRVQSENPRDVVTVFVPEYVVGRWWEQFLHNQSALRIKTRLLFTPGVMVTSVPYQLRSSELVADQPENFGPGAVRRGEPAAADAEQQVERTIGG